MEMKESVLTKFKKVFDAQPQGLVRAPGRVNIIGEHTDYNEGFVLPMTIDLSIWIALRPRSDQRIVLHALNYQQTADFSLRQFDHVSGWEEYIRAVAWVLAQHSYPTPGWEGVVGGDIPTGAGLSSSAAMELALLKAFWSISDWTWDGEAMARLAQQAENSWVGVQSGIMDQMIAALGKEGHALLIDCRSLEHSWVPLVEGTQFLVMDTTTRRGLVDSVYNQRVDECQAAANHFGVPSLRDVSAEELESQAGQLEETLYRRARHVINENERTLQAVEAMERGDGAKLGQLMNASHESLRVDYQVSSRELDGIVEMAREAPGTYGARMTGAGFGGAAIALVKGNSIEKVSAHVQQTYTETMGVSPHIYPCTATQGAERLL